MLIPLPIDVAPKPVAEALESTAIGSGEKPLVDFGSVVEQAIGASESLNSDTQFALSTEALPSLLVPDGQSPIGDLGLDAPLLERQIQPAGTASALGAPEGEVLLSQLIRGLPLEASLSPDSALAGPSEPVPLMSITPDESVPEILVAQAELGEPSTGNQIQSVDQLMPLVGGDQEVGLELGRIRLESERSQGGSLDPRMSQPLQDAILRVHDESSKPVALSPMDSVPVQLLLDSEAIDAKGALRQEALSIVRQEERPIRAAIPVVTPAASIGEGTDPSALKGWNMGIESTPWLGLQNSEGVSPDKALQGFQATSEVLPPIEHALLAANLAEAKPPRAALDIKSMPVVQPQFTPQQSAPWVQALLDASPPAAATVSHELGPAAEIPDEEAARAEASLASESKELAPRPLGTRESGPLRTPLGNPSNSAGEPVQQVAAPTESDPAKATRVLQAVKPSHAMTPQMAMATDDVAEFTVVKPDRMDLRIQDIKGDLEISIAREEEGLAVKVRAPQEIIEDFQGMESDLEAALSEDEQELASFETEVNDQDQAKETEAGSDEDAEKPEPLESRGARVLSRLA